MDEKKRDLLLAFVIIVLIASSNVYLYYKQVKPSVSGMAITEVPKLFTQLNFSVIAFIAQWFLIVVVVILFYVRHLRRKKEEKIKVSYKEIKDKHGRAGTDIDALYSLLREKKHLKISTISKIFSVDKDKALEWCKILENSNLAILNYPAFSEPEVEIIENEGK